MIMVSCPQLTLMKKEKEGLKPDTKMILCSCVVFKKHLFILKERERERGRAGAQELGGGQREKERESQAGSMLTTQSPMWHLIP